MECKNCKTILIGRQRYFCSNECKINYYTVQKYGELKEIHCSYCNKIFLPNMRLRKYCSKKCSRKQEQKIHKERMLKDPIYKERIYENSRRWTRKLSAKPTLERRNEKSWSKRKKQRIDNIKKVGGKCWLCGYSTFLSALEFHHVKGKKYQGQRRAVEDPRSINFKIKECVLLCSNCHQEHHFGDSISNEIIMELWTKMWKIFNEDSDKLAVSKHEWGDSPKPNFDKREIVELE